MTRASVGARLAILNAAVVAAAMAVLGAILFAMVERTLIRGAEGILVDEMAEVAGALGRGPLSPERIGEILREEVADHKSEALGFRLSSAAGDAIARAGAVRWEEIPPARAASSTARVTGDPVRHRLLVRRFPSVSFGPVLLEGSIRLRSADAAMRDLEEVALLLAPALLLAALAAGYFLARRSLRPVALMEATARRIGTGPPGERLPQAGTGDEIDRLAGTLNGMLERIEDAAARNLRFAGDVAHEVRTPLATIRARLEAMPEGGERIEAAVREVERLESLVRGLLLVCRAEEGAGAAEWADMDLSAEVRGVAEFFHPEAAAREVDLRCEAPPGLRVRGEATALRRAVANLVDNAIRFTPAGGAVELTAAADGGRVRIEVRDGGPGIPAGEEGRLFERFFRTAEGRRRHPEGNGLGLCLVRAVARSHGGDATFRRIPGGGSAFRIELPSAADAGSMPRSGHREDVPCQDAPMVPAAPRAGAPVESPVPPGSPPHGGRR